jgi:UDP-2,3-diacylglucosamine hydrolase
MSDVLPTSTRRGLVVSDLHLHTVRFKGEQCFATLLPKLRDVDVLVLNGDIFDFRWSTLPSTEATTSTALKWISNLLQMFPKLEVHYVLGNHDCLREYEQRLQQLSAEEPRFQMHPFYAVIGDAVFLHGDCVIHWMDGKRLDQYRDFWRQDKRLGIPLARLYHVADILGITKLVHFLSFKNQRTFEHIIYYLDDAAPGWKKQVRRCFFGHTHRWVAGIEREGVLFYNAGTASSLRKFRPIFFDVPHGSE